MKATKKRLAVFAHWDKDSLVDPYVVHYLEALSKVCDIIFCSDGHLDDAELAKIEPFTIARIAERHGEYDFGSYKKGYIHASDVLMDYDELVFANDSCYGPFATFERLWEKMDGCDGDFWGILEHYHTTAEKWYVQSFFLVFKRSAFLSPVFDGFMRGIARLEDKEAVIVKCEVGLSDALVKAGFKPASLLSRSESNRTHMGEILDLIGKGEAPLLKKALFSRNPANSPMLIEQIYEFQRRYESDPLFEMICANMRRTVPKKCVNYWFVSSRTRASFLHPKFLRFKEKPLRWGSLLSIKVFGITLVLIPWKINLRRIKYDVNNPHADILF